MGGIGMIKNLIKKKIKQVIKELYNEFVEDGKVSIEAKTDPFTGNVNIEVKYTKPLGGK